MTKCPACDSDNNILLGKIQDKGGIIQLTSPGGLYECMGCHLFFRFPYLSQDELIKQYEKLPDDLWIDDNHDRQDYIHVRSALKRYLSSGDVLDIGCYRGDFLCSLPDRYNRHGIEPSISASVIASEKGVQLHGATINDLMDSKYKYDCIVAIDVIEHLLNPCNFIKSIKQLLKPNGIMIISTGDAGHWLWEKHRLDYWYYYSEHVSFISRPWFRWVAKHLQLKVAFHVSFSHENYSTSEYIRWQIRYIIKEIYESSRNSTSLYKILQFIYPISKARNWNKPLSTQYSNDHFVTVLRDA